MKKTIWVIGKNNNGEFKIVIERGFRIIAVFSKKAAIDFCNTENDFINRKIYSYRKATVEM